MNTFPLSELREVLTRARRTPAYAHLPKAASAREWRRLPLTSKEDLRRHYPFGMLAISKQKLNSYHESSGTTGQPIASYFTDADWVDIQSRFLRNRAGVGAGDTVLVKTPY